VEIAVSPDVMNYVNAAHACAVVYQLAWFFKKTSMPEKFSHNPFANLSSANLPPGDAASTHDSDRKTLDKPRKSRGRVDIIRQKAGRGGKTVTVVKGFVGIGLPEKESLARTMQKACGAGGTVKDGQIEIQGDKREEVARILTEANFRPVFAGG
jgi:translation initiation factor 1